MTSILSWVHFLYSSVLFVKCAEVIWDRHCHIIMDFLKWWQFLLISFPSFVMMLCDLGTSSPCTVPLVFWSGVHTLSPGWRVGNSVFWCCSSKYFFCFLFNFSSLCLTTKKFGNLCFEITENVDLIFQDICNCARLYPSFIGVELYGNTARYGLSDLFQKFFTICITLSASLFLENSL